MNASAARMACSRAADIDSSDLAARAATGDRAAFQQLVSAHHDLVYRWALGALGDADDAEDLSQTVWIKVYRNLSAFRGTSRFTTWLYRVTMNAGSELRRTRARRPAMREPWRPPEDEGSQQSNDVDERLDRSRMADVVRSYLKALPRVQRTVFELVDLEGYAPAEVAAMLGARQVTIRTNLLKARRAMRGRLLQDRPKLIEELRS
jgi:RNA polymerase sigma-70 factor, ECF subfamily